MATRSHGELVDFLGSIRYRAFGRALPDRVAMPQRSTKKMIRIYIALVAASLVCNVQSNDQSTPPDSWKMGFRDDKQEVWDRLRRDDGTVTAEEVIEETLKRGSQHDGDCQVWTAFALMEINDDPIPALRKMMTEEVPERRAFGAMVAGILGDIRLRPDIEKLLNDQTKLGEFPGDWFWDTVADSAGFSISELERGGGAADWIANGGSIAKWLKYQPTKPVEPVGADQPTTAPKSKSGGNTTPKPPSEVRSQ